MVVTTSGNNLQDGDSASQEKARKQARPTGEERELNISSAEPERRLEVERGLSKAEVLSLVSEVPPSFKLNDSLEVTSSDRTNLDALIVPSISVADRDSLTTRPLTSAAPVNRLFQSKPINSISHATIDFNDRAISPAAFPRDLLNTRPLTLTPGFSTGLNFRQPSLFRNHSPMTNFGNASTAVQFQAPGKILSQQEFLQIQQNPELLKSLKPLLQQAGHIRNLGASLTLLMAQPNLSEYQQGILGNLVRKYSQRSRLANATIDIILKKEGVRPGNPGDWIHSLPSMRQNTGLSTFSANLNALSRARGALNSDVSSILLNALEHSRQADLLTNQVRGIQSQATGVVAIDHLINRSRAFDPKTRDLLTALYSEHFQANTETISPEQIADTVRFLTKDRISQEQALFYAGLLANGHGLELLKHETIGRGELIQSLFGSIQDVRSSMEGNHSSQVTHFRSLAELTTEPESHWFVFDTGRNRLINYNSNRIDSLQYDESSLESHLQQLRENLYSHQTQRALSLSEIAGQKQGVAAGDEVLLRAALVIPKEKWSRNPRFSEKLSEAVTRLRFDAPLQKRFSNAERVFLTSTSEESVGVAVRELREEYLSETHGISIGELEAQIDSASHFILMNEHKAYGSGLPKDAVKVDIKFANGQTYSAVAVSPSLKALFTSNISQRIVFTKDPSKSVLSTNDIVVVDAQGIARPISAYESENGVYELKYPEQQIEISDELKANIEEQHKHSSSFAIRALGLSEQRPIGRSGRRVENVYTEESRTNVHQLVGLDGVRVPYLEVEKSAHARLAEVPLGYVPVIISTPESLDREVKSSTVTRRRQDLNKRRGWGSSGGYGSHGGGYGSSGGFGSSGGYGSSGGSFRSSGYSGGSSWGQSGRYPRYGYGGHGGGPHSQNLAQIARTTEYVTRNEFTFSGGQDSVLSGDNVAYARKTESGIELLTTKGRVVVAKEELREVSESKQELSSAIGRLPSVQHSGEQAFKMYEKFAILAEMAKAGKQGNKEKAFVKQARDLARELDYLYRDGGFEKTEKELREALEGLESLPQSVVTEEHDRKIELIRNTIDALSALENGKVIEELRELVDSDSFDAESFGKWMSTNGVIIGTAVVSAVALATLLPSGGASSPVLATSLMALYSAVGAYVGTEVGKFIVSNYNDSIESDFQRLVNDDKFGPGDWALSAGGQISWNFATSFVLMGLGRYLGSAANNVVSQGTATGPAAISSRLLVRSAQMTDKIRDTFGKLVPGSQSVAGRFIVEVVEEFYEEAGEAGFQSLAHAAHETGDETLSKAFYGLSFLFSVLNCAKGPGLTTASEAGCTLDAIIPTSETSVLQQLSYDGETDTLLAEINSESDVESGDAEVEVLENGTIRVTREVTVEGEAATVVSEYSKTGEPEFMRVLQARTTGRDGSTPLSRYGLKYNSDGTYSINNPSPDGMLEFKQYMKLQGILVSQNNGRINLTFGSNNVSVEVEQRVDGTDSSNQADSAVDTETSVEQDAGNLENQQAREQELNASRSRFDLLQKFYQQRVQRLRDQFPNDWQQRVKQELVSERRNLLQHAKAHLELEGVKVEGQFDTDNNLVALEIMAERGRSDLNTYAARVNQSRGVSLIYDPLLLATEQAGALYDSETKRIFLPHGVIRSGTQSSELYHEKIHAVFDRIRDQGGDSLFFGTAVLADGDLSLDEYATYVEIITREANNLSNENLSDTERARSESILQQHISILAGINSEVEGLVNEIDLNTLSENTSIHHQIRPDAEGNRRIFVVASIEVNGQSLELDIASVDNPGKIPSKEVLQQRLNDKIERLQSVVAETNTRLDSLVEALESSEITPTEFARMAQSLRAELGKHYLISRVNEQNPQVESNNSLALPARPEQEPAALRASPETSTDTFEINLEEVLAVTEQNLATEQAPQQARSEINRSLRIAADEAMDPFEIRVRGDQVEIEFEDGTIVSTTAELSNVDVNFLFSRVRRYPNSYGPRISNNIEMLNAAVEYAQLHGAFYNPDPTPRNVAQELKSYLEANGYPADSISISRGNTSQQRIEGLMQFAEAGTQLVDALRPKYKGETVNEAVAAELRSKLEEQYGAQALDSILGGQEQAGEVTLEELVNQLEENKLREKEPIRLEIKGSLLNDRNGSSSNYIFSIERTATGKLVVEQLQPTPAVGNRINSLEDLVNRLESATTQYGAERPYWRSNHTFSSDGFTSVSNSAASRRSRFRATHEEEIDTDELLKTAVDYLDESVAEFSQSKKSQLYWDLVLSGNQNGVIEDLSDLEQAARAELEEYLELVPIAGIQDCAEIAEKANRLNMLSSQDIATRQRLENALEVMNLAKAFNQNPEKLTFVELQKLFTAFEFEESREPIADFTSLSARVESMKGEILQGVEDDLPISLNDRFSLIQLLRSKQEFDELPVGVKEKLSEADKFFTIQEAILRGEQLLPAEIEAYREIRSRAVEQDPALLSDEKLKAHPQGELLFSQQQAESNLAESEAETSQNIEPETETIDFVGLDELVVGKRYFNGTRWFKYHGKAGDGKIRVQFYNGHPDRGGRLLREKGGKDAITVLGVKPDAKYTLVGVARHDHAYARQTAYELGITHERAALWFGMGALHQRLVEDISLDNGVKALENYNNLLQEIAPDQNIKDFLSSIREQFIHGKMNKADVELARKFLKHVQQRTGIDLVRVGVANQTSINGEGSWHYFSSGLFAPALFEEFRGKRDRADHVGVAYDWTFKSDLWAMGVSALDISGTPLFPSIDPAQDSNRLSLNDMVSSGQAQKQQHEYSLAMYAFKQNPTLKGARELVARDVERIKQFVEQHKESFGEKEVVVIGMPGSTADSRAGALLAKAVAERLGYENGGDGLLVRIDEGERRSNSGRTVRRESRSQTSRNDKNGGLLARLRNAGDMFHIANDRETGRTVDTSNQVYIVIDDVAKSDATLHMVRERLSPAEVIVITFGKSPDMH